jgi:hypothetical protein
MNSTLTYESGVAKMGNTTLDASVATYFTAGGKAYEVLHVKKDGLTYAINMSMLAKQGSAQFVDGKFEFAKIPDALEVQVAKLRNKQNLRLARESALKRAEMDAISALEAKIRESAKALTRK